MLNSNEYRPGAGPADNYKQNYEEYKMQTETKRLIIRSFRPGDEKAFAEMAKDGSLREIGFGVDFQDWMGDWAAEAAELTKKDDARTDYIPCTVVLRSTGEIVGNVGCTYFEDLKKVGICYFAGSAYRKQGYISEAVKAYLPFFFEHYNENEIIATIRDTNLPSWKTAEKCGFRLTEVKMYKDVGDEEEDLYRFYTYIGPTETAF